MQEIPFTASVNFVQQWRVQASRLELMCSLDFNREVIAQTLALVTNFSWVLSGVNKDY